MKLRSRRLQRGITALEAIVVLIVAVSAMGMAGSYLNDYADRQVDQSAADHNERVVDAGAKYIKDNYAALVAASSASSPAIVTVPMLKSTGYLSTSTTDLSPFGQSYSIAVLQPLPNKLETLVLTTGGETISEQSLRRIAQSQGARGGYVSATNPALAIGSYAGWQMTLASYGISPGAGHLATSLFFEDGALVSDYLYRNAVAGHPELNRMNTAIDMNGNNLNNAGTVNAVTVAATGNVTAGGNITAAGETYTGGNFRTKGDGGWYSEKWNGGWYMSDSSWIRSYGDKNVYTGGQVQAGTVRANGLLSTGADLQLDGIAVENAGCPQIGRQSRDSAGLPLSCQFSGGAVIWKTSSAGIKNFVTFDWYPGSGTYGTGLPYSQWFCAISHVGGKWAGGGENIQVYRDGGSGTWIVSGTSSSDNTGAFASIGCVQLGG